MMDRNCKFKGLVREQMGKRISYNIAYASIGGGEERLHKRLNVVFFQNFCSDGLLMSN